MVKTARTLIQIKRQDPTEERLRPILGSPSMGTQMRVVQTITSNSTKAEKTETEATAIDEKAKGGPARAKVVSPRGLCDVEL